MRSVGHSTRTIFAALALTGVLLAQSGVSATFVSATEMRVEAWMVISQTKTVPANTDLTKGLSLSVTNFATASTTVGFRHSRTTGTLVTITDSGSTPAIPHVFAKTGLHDTLLTFKSTRPIQARLVLTATSSGFSSPPPAFSSWSYSASVDIGNKKADFVVGRGVRLTKEYSVTLDTKGLALKTRTGGGASHHGSWQQKIGASFSGTLTIQLLPLLDCKATSYGIGCGPLLSGAPTFTNELELRLTKAASNAFGKLIIGLKPLSIRIPGGTCYLNTDILLLLPFTTNSTGAAMHVLPVPPSLKLIFNVQDVLFQKQGNSFVITSTNGLRVNCK